MPAVSKAIGFGLPLCAGNCGVPVVILLSLGIYKDTNSCFGIFNFFLITCPIVAFWSSVPVGERLGEDSYAH